MTYLRFEPRLTALEVAKPHFRVAFQAETRPESSLSMLTIRPSISLTELTALSAPREARLTTDTVPSLPQLNFDVTLATKGLLNSMYLISKELSRHIQPSRLQELKNTLDEIQKSSQKILMHFRAQVTEGQKDLADARLLFSRVNGFWGSASSAAEERFGKIGGENDDLMIEFVRARKATRDSQETAVSVGSPAPSASGLKHCRESETSDTTEECVYPQIKGPQAIAAASRSTVHGWFDLIPHSEHTTGTEVHRKATRHWTAPWYREEGRSLSPGKDFMHLWLGGRKKENVDEGRVSPNGMGGHNGLRFRTWLKKKIVAHNHHHPKPQIVFDVDKDAMSQKAKNDIEDAAVPCQHSQGDRDKEILPMNPLLREHFLALVSSSRDLNKIEECLLAVSHPNLFCNDTGSYCFLG